MSDSFFLQGKSMPISAFAAKTATVFNVGPGTIYWGKSAEVSSASNDGTIVAGGRHVFTSNRWVIADEARVEVFYTPELTTDMATQAELDDVEAGIGSGPGEGGGVLSGNGPPADDLGVEGAFYIQLDSDPPVLYGPKTELGGWGEPVTIGGGAMLNGSGPPSDLMGAEGDFYVDTDNNLLYGPKTDVWGTPIDLSSSTTGGAAGGVLSGIHPNPGFAVDMATQAELDAVEAEIEDIVGVPVLAGLTMPDDSIGLDGSYYFDTGSGNLYGPKTAGAWPIPPVILDGIPMLTGVTEPVDAIGGNGDYYLQTNTSTVFGPKESGEWPEGVSYKGDKGDAGGTFVWRGDWSSGTTYAQYDVAIKAGSQWLSVVASNLNHDPTTDDGSHWALTAQKGNQGAVGSGYPAGLMIPLGTPRPLITSAGAALGANQCRFVAMNPVPEDGMITDVAVYIGTSSGNFKFVIYDTGLDTPGSYAQIWVSSPTAMGAAGNWQTINNVDLPVQAGDRFVFGVVPDNATAAFGRGDTIVSAAAAMLPVEFSPPLGATRVKLGSQYAIGYTSPLAAVTEAQMQTATYIPMLLGMVN